MGARRGHRVLATGTWPVAALFIHEPEAIEFERVGVECAVMMDAEGSREIRSGGYLRSVGECEWLNGFPWKAHCSRGIKNVGVRIGCLCWARKQNNDLILARSDA